MSAHVVHLFLRSKQLLHMEQKELAALMGTSLRTMQGYDAGRSYPTPPQFHRLADAVRPLDPQLAAEIDALAPRPVAVAAPSPPLPAPAPPLIEDAPAPLAPVAPPPPAAPVPKPAVRRILVDSIVCAAAEAMTMAPQQLRPALLAAFVRARDLDLGVSDVVATLEAEAGKL